MKVNIAHAAQILINTLELFGDADLKVEVEFMDLDSDSEPLAKFFIPQTSNLAHQTSAPFTPNIYAPHGAIFSQN